MSSTPCDYNYSIFLFLDKLNSIGHLKLSAAQQRMHTKLTALFPGSENCCKQCFSLCNIQNNGFSTRSRSDALEPELIPALISIVWRHTANPRRLSCRHWWMVIGWKPLSAAWLQCSVQHHKRIIRIQHINPASCPDLLFYDTEMQ